MTQFVNDFLFNIEFLEILQNIEMRTNGYNVLPKITNQNFEHKIVIILFITYSIDLKNN